MKEISRTKKTILLVDDDPTVLGFLSSFLSGQYNILVAKDGAEALRSSKEFREEIHLLLTDFQMKGKSGIEIATEISIQRPDIKVLMMSGFPEGMLVLNEGWHFIAKPFIQSQLMTLITGLVAPTSRFTTAT